MKNPKPLLRVSVIGTVLVALCCFTPILVILLGTVGLAALTGYLDVVLLPALAFFIDVASDDVAASVAAAVATGVTAKLLLISLIPPLPLLKQM